MAKRQTTIEGVLKPPQVGDPAWRGLSPGQRKAASERRLREMDAEPTEAQVREAERLILIQEIAEAEREQAEAAFESLEPRVRSLIADYARLQRSVEAKVSTALAAVKEAAEVALEGEKALRKAQDALARQIEGKCKARLDQATGTPDQIRAVHMTLTLEGSTEFRQRWKALAEEIGARPLWVGIDPGDDPLAIGLRQALERFIWSEVGGRPVPFSSGGQTRGIFP